MASAVEDRPPGRAVAGRASGFRVRPHPGATLGPHSIVLPGATVGDGTVIGPSSLVMRGEQVPSDTRWTGNPPSPRGRRTTAMTFAPGRRSSRRSETEIETELPKGPTVMMVGPFVLPAQSGSGGI
ncbi:hypothetical protein FCI23_10900 [Actinacidiphila oryziradicis]|uniref:Uncharacterized protein n=1 Tax=Actinacidiphila oryziradicis TaxID=2571141 RepID=A0A4U0SSJ9_9ACTN|nr:hypothetical protein FCI23_10900 [Actinacidiphila oryziradicis]